MRRHLLVPSKIEYCDYGISCYDGCGHGCTYCYARLLKRMSYQDWITSQRAYFWTSYSDILRKDIASLKEKPKNILISPMCDPYQKAEEHSRIMRYILPILIEYKLPFSILTKSDLVMRDLDLLKGYDNCKVGFTIITLNDSVRRLLEPMAPSIDRRIKALKKLHDEGIKTWVSVEPILPDFQWSNPIEIILKLKDFVDWWVFGRLNYVSGIKPKLYKIASDEISNICNQLGVQYLIKKEMKA